jgi:hypothetical protein
MFRKSQIMKKMNLQRFGMTRQADQWPWRFSLSKNSLAVIYCRFFIGQTTAIGPWVSTDKNGAVRGYYSDTEVAALLGVSIGRLRNKISAGDPLPPRLQAAGIRKRLWPRQALHEWLRQFEHEEGNRKKDGFLGTF